MEYPPTSRPYILTHFQSSGFGYRHQQCVVLFLSVTLAYLIRSCLGVALVGMTSAYDLSDVEHTHHHLPDEVHLHTQLASFNGTAEPVDNATREAFQMSGVLNRMMIVRPVSRY